MGRIEDVGTVDLAGVCGQTVVDGCDSLLMPVCGSVEGGNLYGSRMGYHGEILLKTNGGQERQK